ncbi:DUF255 domain-containing protein [Nocardioides sp. YR527]|uniref:DUF255 domain-containing protein n=1 Tax=Nocardioides sp. YR527 TaxID=1881028 RepID=UPI00210E6BA7
MACRGSGVRVPSPPPKHQIRAVFQTFSEGQEHGPDLVVGALLVPVTESLARSCSGAGSHRLFTCVQGWGSGQPTRLRDLAPPAAARSDPVSWWEWGPDTFEEARRRGIPLLLSVGYAACHWCHVMLAPLGE